MAEVELPNPEELHEHSVSHFSRRVALVTAIFAVVPAIAALGGNHAMVLALLPAALPARRSPLTRRPRGDSAR
jgi:hypothetical protein